MIKFKGFTLIEILVVIAVLSIAGLLVLYIFTNSLRGSNKAQILSSIKNNGQAVLETMDKTIRGADNVICIGTKSTTNDTLVIGLKDKYTRFRFIAPVTTGTLANGQIQQEDLPKPSPVPASDPNYSQAYFCTDPSVSPQTLTDTNPQTGTSVYSGSFSKQTQAGFKDAVTIQFTLKHGVQAPQALAGQIDPVDFRTTVQLR